MMFAAAIGYRYASRKPLDSGGEGIRWNIFEKNRDDAYINALALAVKTKNWRRSSRNTRPAGSNTSSSTSRPRPATSWRTFWP